MGRFQRVGKGGFHAKNPPCNPKVAPKGTFGNPTAQTRRQAAGGFMPPFHTPAAGCAALVGFSRA